MPVPNEADAGFPDQARLDSRDLAIMDAASGGVAGTGYGTGPTGVQSGAAVTAQGSPDMTVAVAAGVVRIGGRRVVVAAGNVTITAAHATNPRIDLIVVDVNGTKSAIAGTPAASPSVAFPTITAGTVVLAAVYVPANDTAINSNQITDKRVLISRPPHEDVTWYGALGNDSFNCSPAFKAAHDALPNAVPEIGGRIHIPIGRYRLNGFILSSPTSVTATVGGAGGPTGTFFYAVSAFNAAGETLAVATSPTSISLTNQIGVIGWAAVTDAIGYKIYRGTTSTDLFHLAFANGQATVSYNDTGAVTPVGIQTPTAPGLAAGGSGGVLATTTYHYCYTAFNANGETAPSPTASVAVTLGQVVTLTLTAPTNSGGVTGYRIFRGTSSAADSQGFIATTLTTSYVDDGNVTDHGGRKYATAAAGLPNKRNETGGLTLGARQSGIPETVNTSRYGFQITTRGVEVVGEAASMASAESGVGVFIEPNLADMTTILIGSGSAIMQVGPSLKNISVDDFQNKGGCVGIAVAGTNHSRFDNVFVRGHDVNWWFYRTPLGTDCAWNQLHACHGSRAIRYNLRAGNSYGVQIEGGDWVALNMGASFGLDRVNHFLASQTMLDGGLGVMGPPWGGGFGVVFQSLKVENVINAADLDAIGTNSQGRGIVISGGLATTNKVAPTTGLIIRSVKVNNPRIQNWTIEASMTNGVIDKGLDSLIAAANFSVNRGTSRDVIYNVVKLADETRTATTTLADDAEIRYWMDASTAYRIKGIIFFDTVAAADFKYGFAGPASPTLVRMKRTHAIPVTAPTDLAPDVALPTAVTLTGTTTNGGFVEFDAIYHNGTNAGYFSFQWAQNTSDAGSTIVRKGSYIDYVTVG